MRVPSGRLAVCQPGPGAPSLALTLAPTSGSRPSEGLRVRVAASEGRTVSVSATQPSHRGNAVQTAIERAGLCPDCSRVSRASPPSPFPIRRPSWCSAAGPATTPSTRRLPLRGQCLSGAVRGALQTGLPMGSDGEVPSPRRVANVEAAGTHLSAPGAGARGRQVHR